jgi:hypothetical protein
MTKIYRCFLRNHDAVSLFRVYLFPVDRASAVSLSFARECANAG